MECSWLQVFGLLIFVLKTSRLTEMINASRLSARQSGKNKFQAKPKSTDRHKKIPQTWTYQITRRLRDAHSTKFRHVSKLQTHPASNACWLKRVEMKAGSARGLTAVNFHHSISHLVHLISVVLFLVLFFTHKIVFHYKRRKEGEKQTT